MLTKEMRQIAKQYSRGSKTRKLLKQGAERIEALEEMLKDAEKDGTQILKWDYVCEKFKEADG